MPWRRSSSGASPACLRPSSAKSRFARTTRVPSSWSDTAKKGVQLSKPVYFGQMQIYMAYMGLGSALFTALNKDTCEIYHEHVLFDPAAAQALSDKAVDVLRTADAGDLLPRIAISPDFFLCRFCPFAARCWEDRGGRRKSDQSLR